MKLMSCLTQISLLAFLFLGCEPSNNGTEDPPANAETKLVLGPTMKMGAIYNNSYFFYSHIDSAYQLNNGVLVNITPENGFIGSPVDIKVYGDYVILATDAGNLYQYNITGKTWISKTGMGDVYSTIYYLNFRSTDSKLFLTTPGIEASSSTKTWTIDFPFDEIKRPALYSIKLSNGKSFSTIRNLYIGNTNLIIMGYTPENETYLIFQEHGKEPIFTQINRENNYFKFFPIGPDKYLSIYGFSSKATWINTGLYDYKETIVWVFQNSKTVITSKNSALYQSTIVEQISGYSVVNKRMITGDKNVTFLTGDATQIVYQDQNTKQIYKQIIEK